VFSKVLNGKYWYIFFLTPVIVWAVYAGIGVGRLHMYPNRLNYFKDLSVSFRQGRLDIDNPYVGDLSVFKGKKYLYWPAVPALVYMPLTALCGKNTPDTFIVGCSGALNVFLLMILLNLFSKRYELKLGHKGIVFLAVFWGLGTVHFYMSMVGAVWYISQVMAQTFLILSLVCILMNTSLTTLFLSGLFYAMAVYTRNNLVFTIFLVGAIYITKDKIGDKKVLIKQATIFLMPFVVFSLANLAYNWARFGNAFDNGINYHRLNPYFLNNFSIYGYMSLHYVPGNFVREVIMPPPFTTQFPYFEFDPEGCGLLWVSPIFIFIFAAAFYYKNGFNKHILKDQANTVLSYNDVLVMSAAAISGILISLVIFMVMSTGWSQFASRYSLDYQLMMLLFGLFIIKIWGESKIFKAVLIAGLVVSIYINYFGMRFFLAEHEKYYHQRFANIQSTSDARGAVARKNNMFYTNFAV